MAIIKRAPCAARSFFVPGGRGAYPPQSPVPRHGVPGLGLLLGQQPVQGRVLLLGPLRGAMVLHQLRPLTRHNTPGEEPLAHGLCKLVAEGWVAPHEEAQVVVAQAPLHGLSQVREGPVRLQPPQDLHLYHVDHVGDLPREGV